MQYVSDQFTTIFCL